MMQSDLVLRLDRVFKTYDRVALGRHPKTYAVDDVSFVIRQGETFGLVGESGSGKSTLARLILRLDAVTSGRIWFMGSDITHLSPRSMRSTRQNLQIVFQDPAGSLNRRKTVSEIIDFPLRVHHRGDQATRTSMVNEALDLVGLPRAFADRYPHELSGGQGQRVGIARAIVLRPKLVVLDEAVSSLDVSIRSQILNLLRELQDRLGLTYLFISHDLAVVRYMSDHVGVMFRGRIVESGSRAALFTTPLHPYTEELLAAVPGRRQQSPAIPRDAQSTHAVEQSVQECRYRTRCYLGRDVQICREQDPQLEQAEHEHSVACHLRCGSRASSNPGSVGFGSAGVARS